jgi:hypothetical protein
MTMLIFYVSNRIAVYLAHHDAKDRHELLEAIRQAYRDRDGRRPHTETWDRVANISEVCKPFVYNQFNLKMCFGNLVAGSSYQ